MDEGLDAAHTFIVSSMLDDAPAIGATGQPLLLSQAEDLHPASAAFTTSATSRTVAKSTSNGSRSKNA
jgi:hypothetical protein